MGGDASYTDDYTAAEISRRLADRVDQVIDRLKLDGERRGNQFVALNPRRADTNLGSFRVDLAGVEPGRWFDHAMPAASGRGKCLGGDIIDLVAYCAYGGVITTETRAKAFQWAREVLGLPVNGRSHRRTPEQIAADEAEAAAFKAERERKKREDEIKRVKLGKRMWLDARPQIVDTPVDSYLAGRGIDLKAFGRRFGKLPGALRFHPWLNNREIDGRYPALVSLISGPDGVDGCQGCHRAWITKGPDGEYVKAPLKEPRMSMGLKQGGYIPIWRGASGKPLKSAPQGDGVVIAEGVEDALSNAIACPELRHIAAIDLGNMSMITLPPEITSVWISAENDQGAQAISMRNKALRRFVDEGRTVRRGLPILGKDSNDLLRGK